MVEDWNDCLPFLPCIHLSTLKSEYIIFLNILGNHFIVAEDYNAKHTHGNQDYSYPEGGNDLKRLP